MKNLFIIVVGLFFSTAALAQTREGSPDFPGQLIVDLGVNRFDGTPDNMSIRFLGSRVFNIYYMHEIRLGESRFSFNPGIGIGTEKFSFRNPYTLRTDPTQDPRQVNVMAIEELTGLEEANVNRSVMGTNYVDIPLEIRFHTNREQFRRGFWFALGGRVGYLFDADTKIVFDDLGGRTNRLQLKENYNLNRFRYGAHVRLGIRSFNIWGAYYLSPLFRENRGPAGQNTNVFNFGLSLALF
jgi:hypothetical protein